MTTETFVWAQLIDERNPTKYFFDPSNITFDIDSLKKQIILQNPKKMKDMSAAEIDLSSSKEKGSRNEFIKVSTKVMDLLLDASLSVGKSEECPFIVYYPKDYSQSPQGKYINFY